MKEIDNIIQSDLADRHERLAKLLETIEKEDLAAMLARLLLP